MSHKSCGQLMYVLSEILRHSSVLLHVLYWYLVCLLKHEENGKRGKKFFFIVGVGGLKNYIDKVQSPIKK